MEAIDLRDVLKAIQPFVQHEITRSEVQLNIDFPSDMPKVQIDSRRMEEVLINEMRDLSGQKEYLSGMTNYHWLPSP